VKYLSYMEETVIRRKGLVMFVQLVMLCASMNAQVTWKCTYGAFDEDWGMDVLRTNANDIVVVGSSGSFGYGSSDIYAFKVDSNGVRLWSRSFGGVLIDEGASVVEMSDGSYVIAGSTNRDAATGYDGLLIRIGPSGDLIWEKTYGGADWDWFNDLAVTVDGGLILAGKTYSEGAGGQAWILRMNELGDTLWTRHWGDQGDDEANAVVTTSDGGSAWTGSLMVNDQLDAYVVKLDDVGVISWVSQIGGDSLDIGRDVIQTLDGGYAVFGSTRSFAPVLEQFMFKLNDQGNYEWLQHYGQTYDREGYKILQLADGSYSAIGKVFGSGAGGSDMYLLRTDVNGSFILGQTQGGADDEEGFSLVRVFGGYVLCGVTKSYGAGMNDILLIRTDEVGFTDSDDVLSSFDPLPVPDLTSSAQGQLWPSALPPGDPLHLRLDAPPGKATAQVFDLRGTVVATFPVRQQETTTRIPDLAPGHYSITISDGVGLTFRSRFVVVQ
jgi:hypothetical protein